MWKTLYCFIAFSSVCSVFCAFVDHHTKDPHYHLRELGGDFTRIVELEALGPPSPLENTDSTTVYEQIPLVKNPETSCRTLAPRESAKPATLKWVGKIKTPSDHNPIPDTAPYNQKKPPAPSFSLGKGKELDCESRVPTFLGAAQDTGFCVTCLGTLMGPGMF